MRYADISVVIPCYKAGSTIGRAVESVYNQTVKPKEVVLVDDCSPDDSLSVLYSIKDNYPEGWVKVVALDVNVGAGSARNRGWDAASQSYIAFLDSDDSWHPKKIEVQYDWMLSNPDVALSGHAVAQINFSECIGKSQILSKFEFIPISCKYLLFSNCFATSSVMLQSNISQRFLEGKRYCEDYQLWLDICFSGLKCHYLKTAALTYQYKAAYGQGGLSSALWKMEKGELEAYKSLHDRRFINLLQYISISFFSLLKYLKRVIV